MTTEAGHKRLDAGVPSNGRVLIVDDDRDFAAALRNLLALEGYEVDVAHDGNTARTALERLDAEVVLLDLRLGVENGLDLIAPLMERHPSLVFVVMTGYAETEAAVEALRHGAYDFLRKPIDDGVLQAVLVRSFERIRLEQAKLAAERALREAHDGLERRVQERTAELEMEIAERKQAECELDESREILRALADNLPEFISLKDSEGRFLFINKRFEEWVRVDRDEVVGKTVHDIYSAEQAAEFDALDREAFASHSVLSNEVELHYPDGNTRTVVRTRFPVISSDGGVLGLGTINFDVSEHKRIEQALGQARDELESRVAERTAELQMTNEALRVSEARYRAIVEDQTEFIGRSLPHVHTLTFVNEAYARYFDKTPDELIGTSFMGHVPEAERAEVDARLATLGPENPVIHVEHSAITADGEMRWHQWTDRAIFDDDGNITEIQAVGRDITEMKRAADAIRLSEEKFSKAFRAGPDSIVITRVSDGMVIDSNDRFLDRVGREREDVVGRRASDLLTWVRPEDRVSLVKAIETTGECTDLEADFLYADGKLINGLVSARVIEVNGEHCMIIITRDITERKRAERELARANARLNDAIDSIPDGFALYDAADRLVLCNERYREIYRTHADIIEPGSTFEDMLRDGVARGEFPAAIGREEEWIVDRLRAHSDPPGPIEQELSDGRWLRIEERRTHEGGIVGLRTDITKIKRHQHELAKSEARYRAIVEDQTELIGRTLPHDHTLAFVNQAYARSFGKTSDELIGTSFMNLLPEAERAEVASRLATLGPDNPVIGVEHSVLTGDGEVRWHQWTNRAIFDDEENITEIQAVGRDITERKQAENILRESEERYRLLVDLSPAAVFVHCRGKVVFANQAMVELMGAESSERLIGMNALDIMHPDTRERILRLRADIGKHGRPVSVEPLRYLRFDGTEREIESNAAPFTWNGADAFMVVAHDVTERVFAEQALRESEERYRTVVEDQTELICRTTPEGVLTFVNDAYCRYFDKAREELIGQSFPPLVPEQDRARILKEMTKLGPENSSSTTEHRIVDPDGNVRWQEWTTRALYDAGGKVEQLQAVGRDITDRKQAENILRENEQRLRDYADASADWFWGMDANLRFTYMSPNVERILGVAPEWHYGKTREDLLGDGYDRDVWRAHLKALREHEPFRNFEYLRVGDDDVDAIWIRTSGVPVFAADGAFLGYRGTGSDITERRQTEEQLRQAQKMEAVGQLTGGVAHDFNNLLAIVLGNLEMAKEDLGDDGDVADLVGRASAAAQRGATLTHRLLAFSRKQALMPGIIDLNALVAGMTDLLHRTLGEIVEIETVSADDLWRCEADWSQMENALLNLAINARDAMPDGGKLTIETGNVDLDDDDAAARADATPGHYVMVAVADTGAGMARHVIDHAFDPFFTTKDVGGGSGLGLSMIYGFVKQSGGHVTIDSAEGVGTTVKMYLPRSLAGADQARHEERETAPRARGETILVVEDDADVRALTVALLGKLGYDILEAADGESALAALDQASRVDLLFSDVVLPGGMNGPKLAAEVTRREPGVSVIFTSGYTDDAIIHQGRLDNGVELLNKPFRKADLARKVRSVLDKAGA